MLCKHLYGRFWDKYFKICKPKTRNVDKIRRWHLRYMETRVPRTERLLGPPQQPTLTHKIHHGGWSYWTTSIPGRTGQEETQYTQRYLHWDSHHHPAQIRLVARTLLARSAALTDDEHKSIETQHVKNALYPSGYNKRMLQGPKTKPTKTEGGETYSANDTSICKRRSEEDKQDCEEKPHQDVVLAPPENWIRSNIWRPGTSRGSRSLRDILQQIGFGSNRSENLKQDISTSSSRQFHKTLYQMQRTKRRLLRLTTTSTKSKSTHYRHRRTMDHLIAPAKLHETEPSVWTSVSEQTIRHTGCEGDSYDFVETLAKRFPIELHHWDAKGNPEDNKTSRKRPRKHVWQVAGVTEILGRTLRHHDIRMSYRQHIKIWTILPISKEKTHLEDQPVYQILCHSCDKQKSERSHQRTQKCDSKIKSSLSVTSKNGLWKQQSGDFRNTPFSHNHKRSYQNWKNNKFNKRDDSTRLPST